MSEEPRLCRACLQVCDETYHQNTDVAKLLKISYKELFETFSTFTISDSEPQIFCMECSYILVQVYQFKATVTATQSMLDKIKAEEENEEIESDVEEIYQEESVREQDLQDDMIVEEYVIEEVVDDAIDGEVVETIEEEVKYEIEDYNDKKQPEDDEGEMMELEDDGDEANAAYRCTLCNAEFPTESEANEHLKVHTQPILVNSSSARCKYCDRAFSTEEERDNHEFRYCITRLQKEDIMTCKICDKTGPIRQIRLHIANTHRNKAKGPFQCDKCNKWLTSKATLHNHFRCQHLEEKHHCKDCNKTYTSRSGLAVHRQQHHNSEKLEFKCTLCKYATHLKSLLQKHVESHFPTLSFKCPSCSYSFTSEEKLKQHQVVHANAVKRTYPCEKCSKIFLDYNTLKKHEAIHVQQAYRSECFQCDQRFLNNQAMLRHVELAHPELSTSRTTSAVNSISDPLN